jgi:hypothetical protein
LCEPAHPGKPGYELQDGKSVRLETDRLAAWLADGIERLAQRHRWLA